MAKLFWKATAEQSRKLAWYCQFLLSGRVVSTMPPTLSILQWSRPAAMNLDISLAGTVTITVTAWTDESNQQQLFYGPLSRTTRVSRYQKKHSPTHHPDHHPVFISFFHLLRSIASSPFKLRAWQFICTTSLHVLFGLPLGLEPSISYTIHFFTQSVSSFRNTCPYHRNLFCCST